MRIILHRENGHVDFAGRKDDGNLCCTWCQSEPTHRVMWASYQYGDLVCIVHAQRLLNAGADRVVPRHTLSSVTAGRTA